MKHKSYFLFLLLLISFLYPATVFSATWSPMNSGTTNNLIGVWGNSGTDVFAVGYNGTILHYNGNSWSPMSSGTTNVLFNVWGTSSTNVFAVGANGTILNYSGSSWTAMNSGTTYDLYNIWGSSGSDVFAVGLDGNTILHYDGSTWTSMSSGTTGGMFYGVWGSSGTDVFAVGWMGNMVHYNGSAWAPMASGATAHLLGIWGTSGTNVFAVGLDIIHYNGSAWSHMTSGTTQGLFNVWGSSGSDVFAVGMSGTILHYNGSAWSSMTSGTTRGDLRGIWGSSGTDVFAVGYYGTILHYTNNSTTTTIPVSTTTTELPSTTIPVTTIPSTTTTVQPPTTTTIPTTSIPETTTIPVTTTVIGGLTVDFVGSPTFGSAPLTVTFTNLSSGNISGYLWNFGDGGTSGEMNPTHVYTKMGNYAVILTANSPDGTSKQAVKANYVFVIPGCMFTTSLDNQEEVMTLRALRDVMLNNISGIILASLYYNNYPEFSQIITDNPQLQERMKELVKGNINIAREFILHKQVILSQAAVNEIISFLDELKAEASPKLQCDIDLIIRGIEEGYLLKGMGISIE